MGRDFDLLVVGGGSAGVRCARTAAGLGARVALVEQARLGGTCVNLGCVPKKLLVYAAGYGDVAEDAAGFGWTFEGARFDWPALVRNVHAEVARLNAVYQHLLDRVDVTTIRGRAVFTGPHEVTVGDRRITADHLVVATGGRPRRPSLRRADLGVVSDDMFDLPALPRRAVIVGGGYIAVEFAGILQGLGSRVTLLVRSARILRTFDEDVSTALTEAMRRRGVDIRLETQAECLERLPDGAIAIDLDDGTRIAADLVLFAIGRVPNTRGLGLEAVGVALRDDGSVVIDGDDHRTTVPSIHALGDVTGHHALTPIALAEGTVLARRLFGGSTETVDTTNVPTAVFSLPSVATVGLTERQARREHDVAVYRSRFRPMRHTLSGREERTMVKVVVDRATDRVLGCHMVGPDAAEILQGFAVAVRCGLTKAQLDATIGIHPTAAEEFVTLRTPIVH